MKNLIILVFVSLVFIMGCKVQSSGEKKGSDSVNVLVDNIDESNSSFVVKNGLEKGDTLFASIEKGPCFGNCPTYKMYIYGNGMVLLDAVRGVDLKGSFIATLSSNQMHLILTKAKEIRFEEMKSVYDNKSVTDLPMVKTSIVLNGSRKEVKRRCDYPREILELEKMFDNLLDELKWEKTKEVSNN